MKNKTCDKKASNSMTVGITSFILNLIKKIIILFVLCIFTVLSLNYYVILRTDNLLYKNDELLNIKEYKNNNFDAAFILGCAVYGNTPSNMLKDRLDAGIKLYKAGIVPKLVMSGDNGSIWYNEVNVMKKYAIDRGVNSSDIFMDHAGFSTYDSMYRAKEIFDAQNIIVVTQEYHEYRTLYIANSLEGLNAIGYSAKNIRYKNLNYDTFREILARNKDVIKSIIQPSSKFLGEKISLKGDGNITNEKF